MKIAVTYEDGKVFQHLGHSEAFKVYEVDDNKIIGSEIVEAGGAGHEALAGLLAEAGVNVLICGGIGQGAQDALVASGIEVISGIEGDADSAFESFLRGELISAGVNCDHHDHDHDHECGDDCGCSGGCAGCGGGCGAPQIVLEGPNAGKVVKVHYKGTLNDGSVFDSSYDRGEPLQFICGAGMMISGFDEAVLDMNVGDKKDIHLTPDMAYGEYDPDAVFSFLVADMPGAEDVEVGQQVFLTNAYGQPFPVIVKDKDDTNITFDANHQMAGKDLNFSIEMIEIQ